MHWAKKLRALRIWAISWLCWRKMATTPASHARTMGSSPTLVNKHRGALRGTPGSACPKPESNATELPSSTPGRPKLIELHGHQAFAHADTRRGKRRHDAGLWTCRPLRQPSLRPCRHAEHLAGLQIVRLRALARRRAPSPTGARRKELRTSPGFRPRCAAEKNFARRRAADLAALRALAHADSHRRKLFHALPSSPLRRARRSTLP